MDITIDVSTSGPLFSRLADIEAAHAVDHIGERIIEQGLAEVHEVLDRRIRNPTPYYEVQLTIERVGDLYVAHDRDIVYGPWLEGVGSRNRTTRFKGYWAWRTGRQRTERMAPRIAELELRRFVERIGG